MPQGPDATLTPQPGGNWNCPYCQHAQVLATSRMHKQWHRQRVQNWERGVPAVLVHSIVCANHTCRKLTLMAALSTVSRRGNDEIINQPFVKSWTLLPPSSAKPQPDFIPQPIRDDYYEACAIRDLSPKASATITRRCLQGMIRDFCGISKGRLIDEIKELRKRVNDGQAPSGVQPDTVDAIDGVREVGNVGAHMKADINVIVDVDPHEAQILIELVELLFLEWYVARDARTTRLDKLKSVATGKAKQKQPPPPSPESGKQPKK
jgi:hypothetical protein